MIKQLNLQFFADEQEQAEDGTNVTSSETKADVNPTSEESKKFTQDDLNKINIKGKEAELKRILKKSGFSSEDDLFNYLNKVKDYDDKVLKMAELEKQVQKNTYLAEIRKCNVAEEYLDSIYTLVTPAEKEKIEDYANKVNEFLKTHPAFVRQSNNNQASYSVNTNLDYKGGENKNKSYSISDAIRATYKK